jgi:hypothetical protein
MSVKEYLENEDFMMMFKNLMDKHGEFWNLDEDEDCAKALLAIRELCMEDYSGKDVSYLQILLKKIGVACYEVLYNNCKIGD